jgi:hopene-associated glycosyltransferase HpnB
MGLVLVSAASVAIWLYLLFGRRAFWRMREAPPEGTLPIPPPSVVAIIPARNEAQLVGQAVASLAAQCYPGAFHIVLADDDSRDGTARAASAAATSDRLTIVSANPLPQGWTGKLWALSQGIGAAQPFHPEYLLLTDADIVHPPDNLASLVARATCGGYDLVSYMAALRCHTFAEQALIPAFVFFFFMLYPPAWVPKASRSPRHSTAAAAGGCILIRRAMLERLGGIASIRGELIDDCALARAVQQSGGRVWLGLSPATRSIRAYAGFAEIGLMISRTAFTQLGHSTLLLMATAMGLVLTYLVPPALTLLADSGAPRGLAAIAWLLMSVAYWPALRYYARPVWWAPLLPLVAAFYLAATLHSAVAYWRGSGGMWKGRAQDAGWFL